MQGNEMKAVRWHLGMTQGQLADALGLTGTYVGLMERDEKPIEKRTALAVQHLMAGKAPLYGWRETKEFVGDVPLARAMLIWDEEEQRVKVVGDGRDDDKDLGSSYGACSSDWQAADTVGQLLRLFSRFHELVVEHKIPPQTVHKAMLVVPEYRAAVSLGTIPDEYRNDD